MTTLLVGILLLTAVIVVEALVLIGLHDFLMHLWRTR